MPKRYNPYEAVYIAIRNKTEIDRCDYDLFYEHIQWELEQKHKYFTGQHLGNEPHLKSILVHHIFGEIAIGVIEDKFDASKGTFKNWVDGIVRNVLFKHYAVIKSRNMHNISLDDMMEQGEDLKQPDGEPELSILRMEERDEINQLISMGLTKLRDGHIRYYQILYSRYFEQLTTSQTAQKFGMNNQDVSRILERAKRKFKEIISKIKNDNL